MPPYISWLYFSCWWWILNGKNTLLKLQSIPVHGECRTWAGALGTLFRLNIHALQEGSSTPSGKGLPGMLPAVPQSHPRWQRRKQRCVNDLLIPSNDELQTDWKISRKCLSWLDFVPAVGLYVPLVVVTHTPDIKRKRLLMVLWTENWHTF